MTSTTAPMACVKPQPDIRPPFPTWDAAFSFTPVTPSPRLSEVAGLGR